MLSDDDRVLRATDDCRKGLNKFIASLSCIRDQWRWKAVRNIIERVHQNVERHFNEGGSRWYLLSEIYGPMKIRNEIEISATCDAPFGSQSTMLGWAVIIDKEGSPFWAWILGFILTESQSVGADY